jgi:glutaminyl-tRNA synthetase
MNFIEEIIEAGDKSNLKFRFPPEPNGHLHLGHAKAICLNFDLAHKYKTGCNLRFDDTNPLAESSEFADSIMEDVAWLGYRPSEVEETSNYFAFIQRCAVQLITDGNAYMDDSTSEEIAELKGDLENPGIDSPYRNRTVEENLELFEKLCNGEIKTVLRAKIDMKDPNLLMRDPVIYRSIDAPHHNTGTDFKAYPMYDFAHPISDWKEDITHSLCTLEFEAHRPFYNWTIDKLFDDNVFGVNPRQIEFSRLNVEGFKLSKRYLKELVEEGVVDGWDDPRMPTLKGLKRRGFTPDSIKNFCEKVGISKRESMIERSLLDGCIRDDLNKNSLRRMFVKDPIKLTIVSDFKPGVSLLENNPEDPSMGNRKVDYTDQFWIEREDFRVSANKKYKRLKLGGNVRLKGVCIVKAVDYTEIDGVITEVFCEHYPDSFSGMDTEVKAKGVIHWVDRQSGNLANLNHFEGMEKSTQPGYGEPSLDQDFDYPVQFIRHGYYMKDGEAWNHTVSLKSSYTVKQ